MQAKLTKQQQSKRMGTATKLSTNTMQKLQQARSLSVPSRECAHTRMKRPENGPAKMDEIYDPKMDELEREQKQRM